MSERKTRSDAFEHGLSDVQFMTLRDGLCTSWSYEQAKTWLAVECGVEASDGSLNRYWRSECAPVLSQRRQLAAMKAEQIAREAGEAQVDWDGAAMERLRQLTFEFLMESSDKVDTASVTRLMRTILKDRAMTLDETRMNLLIEKERKAEAAKKDLEQRKADGGMSPETLELIERTLGML